MVGFGDFVGGGVVVVDEGGSLGLGSGEGLIGMQSTGELDEEDVALSLELEHGRSVGTGEGAGVSAPTEYPSNDGSWNAIGSFPCIAELMNVRQIAAGIVPPKTSSYPWMFTSGSWLSGYPTHTQVAIWTV